MRRKFSARSCPLIASYGSIFAKFSSRNNCKFKEEEMNYRKKFIVRRRPVLRSKVYPEVSQHYELILDGAVRQYRDGREVCVDSAAGWHEYKRRVEIMVQRQNYRCIDCHRRLAASAATFQHQKRRGMGAAFRDDRIVDENGNPKNGASHRICNSDKG